MLNRVLRHNLNNEMNVVIGNAELLEARVSAGEENLARAIRKAGQRLVAMGRKARQAVELQDLPDEDRTALDLTRLVEGSLEKFRAGYPDLAIELDLPTAPARIVGHEDVFPVALDNIIENSIEHNDADRPSITIAISASPDVVTVSVSDNGPGIPETETAVIEAGTESQLRHGTGIGLWLAYWCTVAEGGDLRFDTSADGSTVRMEFPPA